jgi:plasmid stabilization system protein ParE
VSCAVRFTKSARADLRRLYDLLLASNPIAAERARHAIGKALTVLADFPFSCRKHDARNPFLRELVISVGPVGYVALVEIESQTTVTVLAVRHQREADFR